MPSEGRRRRGSRTKASTASSEMVQPPEEFRRQAPVSCRFCRSRKLRCSRGQPCTNCRSRGIACEPCGPSELPSTEITAPSVSSTAVPSVSLPDISERLRLLEETVATHEQRWDRLADGTSAPRIDAPALLQAGSFDATPSLTTLKRVSMDKASFDLAFGVAPLSKLADLPPWAMWHPRPARCIWLPPKPEARALLSKYVDDVNCLHHVFYTPSFPTMLDEVYAGLEGGSAPDPARISLLLAVFVSAEFLWTEDDSVRGLHFTSDENRDRIAYWVAAVREIVDCRFLELASLEVVQALLLISSIARGSEAIGPAHRYLQSAICMARELGLHRCDDPGRPCLSIIQRQVERRTWWFLTSFDWLAPSLATGPERDFYQLQPRQMRVEPPAHVNDADLTGVGELQERPLTEPTEMSYPLLRFRLASISRLLGDFGPHMQPAEGLQIHEQLRAFERDIPPFFSMTWHTLSSTYGLDRKAACGIVTQGHALRAFVNALYRRVLAPYHTWPTPPEPIERSIAETEPRIQRIVLHINICLYNGIMAGVRASRESRACELGQSLAGPVDSSHSIEGEGDLVKPLDWGTLSLSISAQKPGDDVWGASGDGEWDGLPYVRFL
ncbi:hypothetical protein GQ53DRAFT_227405 [Thozetella sp. PMI_491]|nr:hypothetical protein GQ53DRAFT_227405 [Thozetella sp. PMI_491]